MKCLFCKRETDEPTTLELKKAQARLEMLENVSNKCDWENSAPSADALFNRDLYNRILDAQSQFESRYY